MYLKCHRRFKDGKEHRYWSIAEKRRVSRGRSVDRHILYLGEINDSQRESWLKSIQAFDEHHQEQRRLALFPSDRNIPDHAREFGVQVKLSQFRLHRPRQWGGCWAFCRLWQQLQLDEFWRDRLADSREGTSWYHVLMVLTAYQLLDPGSEWRLHREWYVRSAMADLLGEDGVIAKDTLYRCLDKLREHKAALFDFLRRRWQDLFGATFDVLLYDLTSTYFESDPPFPAGDKRRHGYSRDHRPDCVQVVMALIVTPEGLPLTYEVMAGNTADCTTLPAFLEQLEARYGKADRVWVMDRGVPTEAHLAEMRRRGAHYLVGTPKGRLSRLEKALASRSWEQARPEVKVKLLPQEEGELYVFVESERRLSKERAMRRKKLKWLWKRLKELQRQSPSYEQLLMKLGAAQKQVGRVARLVRLELPEPPPKNARSRRVSFAFSLDQEKLRTVRRREGRYLLRSNLTATDPAELWQFYLQLVEIEATFKDLKSELAIRPIFHQREDRIEAHIFVAFLAYCVYVTFKQQLKVRAPGLTVRQALDKLQAMQLLDVHFPTTDGRELIFTRYTEPERDQQLLLAQLGWTLPPQAPPRITAANLAQQM